MNSANKYKYELLLLILFIAFLFLITLSSSDPLVDLIFKRIDNKYYREKGDIVVSATPRVRASLRRIEK